MNIVKWLILRQLMQIALRKIYLDNLTSYDENITKLSGMVKMMFNYSPIRPHVEKTLN